MISFNYCSQDKWGSLSKWQSSRMSDLFYIILNSVERSIKIKNESVHSLFWYLHVFLGGERGISSIFSCNLPEKMKHMYTFPVGLLHFMYSHMGFSIHMWFGKTYFFSTYTTSTNKILNVLYTPLQYKPHRCIW